MKNIFRVDNTVKGNKWNIFTRMIVKNGIKIGFEYLPVSLGCM